MSVDDLRFTVHVSIDALNGEGDREPKGRLIHVMVTTYGSAAVAGRKVAVCPNLILDNLVSRGGEDEPLKDSGENVSGGA